MYFKGSKTPRRYNYFDIHMRFNFTRKDNEIREQKGAFSNEERKADLNDGLLILLFSNKTLQGIDQLFRSKFAHLVKAP
jgi:hypothetical protein